MFSIYLDICFSHKPRHTLVMSNDKEDNKTEDVQCLLEHFMRNSYKARENDTKVHNHNP